MPELTHAPHLHTGVTANIVQVPLKVFEGGQQTTVNLD